MGDIRKGYEGRKLVVFEPGMKLYHATLTSYVPEIMEHGLKPSVGRQHQDGEWVITSVYPVHLSTEDETDLVIFLHDDLDKDDPAWADETVTLFEVEVGELLLEHPGPDGDTHYMSYGVIPPSRIKVAKVCTREYIDSGTFSEQVST